MRDSILDVAARVFAEKGYRGTHLGDVSDALGVTRQALYYYFPNKYDILQALFMRFFDYLEAATAEAAQLPEGAARFRAMLRVHTECVAADPAISSIFTEERANLPAASRKSIARRRRAYHEMFANAYEAAVADGEFRDDVPAHVAVSLILGAANWTYRWYTPSQDLPAATLAAMADSLLAGGFARATGDEQAPLSKGTRKRQPA